jgi:predicted phosphate transport protein (TIGR00153 family)
MDVRRWFRSFAAGEGEILSKIEEHVGLALRAAELTVKAFGQVATGDLAMAHATYAEVDRAETEADAVHREVVERLRNGVFFSNLGTDMMDLAENVDGIADSAKDATRILTQRPLKPEELKPFSERLKEYLEMNVMAVKSLSFAVLALGKERESVIRHARATEECEEHADVMKNAILEQVLSTDLPILSILQLRDFVNMADNISDCAEDAADVLYVIMSKGYS